VAISFLFSTAIGGLNQATRRSEAAAVNIVNANTPGFTPVSAVGAAASLIGTAPLAAGTGVDAQLAGRSGVDEAREITDLIRAETAFKAAGALIRVADELSETLIDAVG